QKDLCLNLQTDKAAGLSFLISIAYWAQQIHKDSFFAVEYRVSPIKDEEMSLSEKCHWHRSLFLLEQYKELLGDRLDLKIPLSEKEVWPKNPIMNVAQDKRNDQISDNSEHNLEVFLTQNKSLHSEFLKKTGAKFQKFERQLPVGLFEDEIKKSKAWTPGGASQIDLWGASLDSKEFHLFELKAKNNKKVGVLPEVIYYTQLLSHVQRGTPNGEINFKHSDNDIPNGLLKAKNSENITAWILAPKGEIHPFVLKQMENGQLLSPLEWFNKNANAQNIQYKIFPFELDEGLTHTIKCWCSELYFK
ncbi:MAG: hypothetical protein QNL04_08355, partial [SAR324 cluster bacterium]|nr:hypothetical protein [SAR324 cluster bacterium]